MDSKGPAVTIGKIKKGYFESSNERHQQHHLIAYCLILQLRAWPKLSWPVTIGSSTPACGEATIIAKFPITGTSELSP